MGLEELDGLLDEKEPDVKKMKLERVLEETFILEQEKKAISDRLKLLHEVIGAEADEEPGEHSIVCGDYVGLVKRSEMYSWDEEELRAIVDGLPAKNLPKAVAVKISVNRTKFDAMDSTEQAPFLPALTVKPGRTTIKVSKKEEPKYET